VRDPLQPTGCSSDTGGRRLEPSEILSAGFHGCSLPYREKQGTIREETVHRTNDQEEENTYLREADLSDYLCARASFGWHQVQKRGDTPRGKMTGSRYRDLADSEGRGSILLASLCARKGNLSRKPVCEKKNVNYLIARAREKKSVRAKWTRSSKERARKGKVRVWSQKRPPGRGGSPPQ